MYTTEIKLRGRYYKIEVIQFDPNVPGLCWRAYKQGPYGWEKIPCSSRADENAFPESVAWAATCFLNGIAQAKAEGR